MRSLIVKENYVGPAKFCLFYKRLLGYKLFRYCEAAGYLQDEETEISVW